MNETKDGTVALFSTSFLPYSQTFVYDEIRAHKRYDVDVFCKERRNVDTFPYDRVFKPRGRVAETLYENLAYWPAFDRVLRSGSHAVIHAHFGTGAVYALPYVKKYHIPFVVTFHGNDLAALIGRQRFRPHRWRYVLRAPSILQRADLLLGVSPEFCNVLAELSGRPDAVRLYRVGVDLTRYRRSAAVSDVGHVVMVGRFTEKKGHIYALQAFDQVIRQGRRAHLTLVGDGELEGLCRDFVAAEGLERNVTFAGALSPEKTVETLAAADIALAPSVVARNGDREGGPIVVREAGACRVPVIGTRHGGIPEAIEDGVTGYLVPERDAAAIAEKLLTLLDDPGRRERFGAAARAKMEREFDLFKQVDLLESYYDSIR